MFDDDDADHEPRVPELSQDVQALIDNGLAFLNKAREELEAKKTKFSIVSFWTAVEILLKVPLAHEHWSLVCSRKMLPKKQTYLDGDFQSITYDETRTLLRDVLQKPLSDTTHNVFDKIRKHRNRVVHFYHPSFTDAEKHQIQKEQADAWFALNRLMRDEWESLFGGIHSHSWQLAYGETRLLRGNEFYAAIKLSQVKQELDALAKAGIDIQTCVSCRQKAQITSTQTTGSKEFTLFSTRCRVCTEQFRHISFICPDCDERQSLPEGDEPFLCENCELTEDRMALLDEETFRSVDEQLLSNLPAGCTNCMVPHSICLHGDGYLCTQCLSYYHELETCECCNHLSDSVPEFSRYRGCEFCDGDSRYHDD
ncbi:hsdR (plasmid) [Enterobacter hormaechei]|uniref:hsdR n=1 Tax=Enterobacter cloacae complex TaxID=354276 RepID=UPI000F82D842|nr:MULTISPECIES: hsdR [Enterobacter cloacae complex]MBK2963412.1 hsdR [Klebsiella pneumoniae]MBT1855146.1 hsdR [Enterobacter hormaechei subsp. hoffmannii]HAS0824980.1 hsdR [Enterobacter cloacae subsp. cloacae]MCJ5899590.1 hsdR [Klebsiella pneumoniae]MCJ5910603.1 hsdR [Klebsiella pneumoniae]